MPQQEHCFSTYPHEKTLLFPTYRTRDSKRFVFFIKVCDVLSHISCAQLCDPMDCSPPGFSVHGMLQARILEWGVMLSSRESSVTQGLNLHLLSPAPAGRFSTTSCHLGRCYTSNLWEVLNMSSCCWLNCIPFSLHWEAPVWGDISCWVPQTRVVSGGTMTGTATSL